MCVSARLTSTWLYLTVSPWSFMKIHCRPELWKLRANNTTGRQLLILTSAGSEGYTWAVLGSLQPGTVFPWKLSKILCQKNLHSVRCLELAGLGKFYWHTDILRLQEGCAEAAFPNALDFAREHPKQPWDPRTLMSYGTWFEKCQSE